MSTEQRRSFHYRHFTETPHYHRGYVCHCFGWSIATLGIILFTLPTPRSAKSFTLGWYGEEKWGAHPMRLWNSRVNWLAKLLPMSLDTCEQHPVNCHSCNKASRTLQAVIDESANAAGKREALSTAIKGFWPSFGKKGPSISMKKWSKTLSLWGIALIGTLSLIETRAFSWHSRQHFIKSLPESVAKWNMADSGKIWRDWRLEVDLEIGYDWRRLQKNVTGGGAYVVFND